MNFWRSPDTRAGFEHSRLLTAHYSKSFYLSARLLPSRRRWATFALYGFCRYADNLIDNPRGRTTEELLEEVKFLTRELRIAYRTGESEHPVIAPFIVVARAYNIPIDYPSDLLKGVAMDLTRNRYETFDDLYLFCYRVAGVVGLMMTHVLGCKSKEAFLYAEKLGIAMQLTNILRDVMEDKNMGRIYLPMEELKQFGVQEQDILQERTTDNVRQLMRFQTLRAHRYYREAATGIPMLNRKSQFAIYSASKIYQSILLKIEARHHDPFQGRVFVPQLQKFRILAGEIFRTRLLPAFAGQ